MKILAIDTATEACSVAVATVTDVMQKCAIRPIGQPPAHSKWVLRMVDEVLQESGVSLHNLDVIAVNTGPGSFTGVRIGLGVAQGLAYGADLAVSGICSLEVLAASVTTASVGASRVFPAIDARMNQIYCGLYDVVNNAKPRQRHPPVVVDPAAIPFQLNESTCALGSGWDVYADAIITAIGHNQINGLSGRYPEAKYLAKIAQQSGITAALTPLQLQATYVRNNIVRS